MTLKNKLPKKMTSLILTLALFLTCFPVSPFVANAAATPNTAVDGPTFNDWTKVFSIDANNMSTENAGGIWTDKSVFNDNQAFGNTTILKNSDEDFLVALSAIASNMSITGQSSVPTDTVLILDVSGSMEGRETALVSAANQSIAELLENNSSRVGVVLYSGSSDSMYNTNASAVLLPLGHYRTGADGAYLNFRNNTISLDSDVVYDGGTNDGQRPETTSKEVMGATFIQRGLLAALDQFERSDIVVDENDPRKPIIVLMSDGAPTLATYDFENDTRHYTYFGSGGSSNAQGGFVTQLTAAYVKKAVSEKYKKDALFYTLGLGINSITNDTQRVIANCVLDPDYTSNDPNVTAINNYWTRYNNATLLTSGTATNANRVSMGSRLGSTYYVTKTQELSAYRNYADKSFSAASTTDLVDAFEELVGEIALQSKYYPTLVQGAEEHSGFITFVDKIGKYMNVTDIKGIIINNVLFSGADLASNFREGSNALGTVENPTALGEEIVLSVRERLGLTKAGEDPLVGSQRARTLIGLAYQNGQLSYNSATDFSNYIGWYANQKGEYLGFWHEGITTMPDPNDPTLTDETRPYYIVKSYGYFGETDHTKGVDKSNMLYATVQVREQILTGEQLVTFAVPAALIPTVTYEVTLDENQTLTALEASGATSPIRLVYGVALNSDINAWSIRDRVDAQYIADNTDASGHINFYSNQFDENGAIGYGTDNTYSYFRPAMENDRYYYQEDSYVYDSNSNRVKTVTAGETYYHKYDVYQVSGGRLSTTTVTHDLKEDTVDHAQTDADGYLYVPKGHVRRDYVNHHFPKNPDNTNTPIDFSASPFADYGDPSTPPSASTSYVFGVIHGNNGVLKIEPQTGIKITKTLEQDAAPTDASFTFKLQGPATLNGQFTAFYRENNNSSQTTVTFTNGEATVDIKAGQTLYIGGLTAGDVITVTETPAENYILSSVDGDTQKTSAALTVVDHNFVGTEFSNTDRGFGSLAISKEIHHDYGTTYQIPAKEFKISVMLDGYNTQNNTYDAVITHIDNTTTVSPVTTVNGEFEVTLKHDEHILIEGLPAGTVATVVEQTPGTGFAPKYLVDGAAAVTTSGVTTVRTNHVSWVDVQNFYTATAVSPELEVKGIKNLNAQANFTGDFEFKLQRYNPEDAAATAEGWVTIDTQTVSYNNELGGQKSFTFGDVLNAQVFDKIGKYYYRVAETVGDNHFMAYDEVLHSFTINVTDADMDGALEIAVTTTRPEVVDVTTAGEITATFTNTLRAEATVQATIDVQKAITDLSGSEKGKDLAGYTFELSGDGISTPITLTTNNRGVVRFITEYKESDLAGASEKVFTYTLKEVAPATYDNTVWTYDDSVYTVEVKVTKTTSGGEVTLHAVVTDNGQNTANSDSGIAVTFTNGYNPKDAELTIDFVEKIIEGRDFKDNETFTFGVFQIVDSQGTMVSTGTSDSDGKVTFDKKLTFDKVGYYEFEIKETSQDVENDGITNDDNVYKILVTVADDPANPNALKATYALLNQTDSIVFKNVYKASDFEYTLKGEKVLKNMVLVNDEFAFEMVNTDENGVPKAGATPLTARNLSDGNFTFPTIKFTSADAGQTYYYKVSEVIPTGDTFGIKYDQTQYLVKLEVSDNLEGEIVVKETYSVIGQTGTTDAIYFENKYEPAKATVEVAGTKVIESIVGRTVTDKEFEFNLYSVTDDTYAAKTFVQKVSNDANGVIKFDNLEFTQAGIYYYLVTEVNAGQTIDFMTYDTTEYRIKITVEDNKRGNLIPTVEIFDQYDVPQGEIEFINLHKPDPEAIKVEVKIDKTLKGLFGREYNPKGFEFRLEKVGTQESMTVKSDENGDAKFVLDYDKDDINQTYTYLVSEVKGSNLYVGYSKAVYSIKITLSLNEQNVIVPTVTKDGIAVNADNIVTEFINMYIPETPSTPETPRNPTTGGEIR